MTKNYKKKYSKYKQKYDNLIKQTGGSSDDIKGISVLINNIPTPTNGYYVCDEPNDTFETYYKSSHQGIIINCNLIKMPVAIECNNIRFSDNVEEILKESFQHCDKLKGNLVLSNSITSIGANAFQYCNGFTDDLILPSNLETIGDKAFEYCYGFNGKLIIPNSVETIQNEVFSHCSNFKELTLPDNLIKKCFFTYICN